MLNDSLSTQLSSNSSVMIACRQQTIIRILDTGCVPLFNLLIYWQSKGILYDPKNGIYYKKQHDNVERFRKCTYWHCQCFVFINHLKSPPFKSQM